MSLLALALFTLVVGANGYAAEGDVQCGSVITEDTVLTHDLLDCEDGLVVAAPGVTLDLGGHQIVGRGTGKGVWVQIGASGSVVRNGAIRAFGTGVLLFGQSLTASHLDLGSNGTGLSLCCTFSRVEGSTIHGNEIGIRMLYPYLEVVDNRILKNDTYGIHAGLGADNSRLEGNLVMGNGGDGVFLELSTASVLGNTFSRNGGDGLAIQERCGGYLNFYRVGSNLADGNQGLGINVRPFNCGPDEPYDLLDAGGNAAKHNGDPQECTFHVVCAFNRGQADKLAPVTAIPQRRDEDS